MKENIIVILTGPSGSGKTTVCEYIVEKYNFVKPKTYTTRKPRPEENDDSYIFISKEEFVEKIPYMSEYVLNHGNYYGSSMDSFNINRNIVIALDHRGALSVKNMYPDKCIVIMLNITKESMLERINQRSAMSEEQVTHRLKELDSYIGKYDYTIDATLDIEQVKNMIDEILISKGC